MARFFLPKEKIHGSRGVIDGQELAHLGRVLRLRAGDSVTVFDDSGWEHDAVIESVSAAQGELKILRSFEPRGESARQTLLAFGWTKGEKTDFVVGKAPRPAVQTTLPL